MLQLKRYNDRPDTPLRRPGFPHEKSSRTRPRERPLEFGMLQEDYDAGKAARWRTLRNRIRMAGDAEKYRLLRYFGDEIRSLAPVAAKASANAWDINVTLELATAFGALTGGCWNAWPPNPDWPGRDRLFVCRRSDLLLICCGLANLGFFPTDQVANIVDKALVQERNAVIRGLETPGATPEEMLQLAWESALESARSKRRWRDYLGLETGKEWTAPHWRASSGVWRTYIVFDAFSSEAALCRALPQREGETPACLTALVTAPRSDAAALAEEWRDAGWEAAVVARSDCLGLYQALTSSATDKPSAVLLAIGQTPSASSRTGMRRKEPELLGEMSDEQFNTLLGESIQF